MTFPAHIDVEFYQSKHELPEWAHKLVAKRKDERWALCAMIDVVVNVHGGQKSTSGEMAAHSLMAIVRSWRRRGLDVKQRLEELVASPGCAINPEKRAAFARKWARRMQGASA